MEWLVLTALGALSVWMWIVGGRTRPVRRPAHAAAAPVRPPEAPSPEPHEPPPAAPMRASMRLGRCPRCGAWRVEGARCHDSRGYPRG